MSGFRFINPQGELQVFGRQEGGSILLYLVCFMLGKWNSLVQDVLHPTAIFQQLDDEFLKCHRIVCPIMVGYLMTSKRNCKFNAIFG
jgi:hypothetical protein